MAQQKGLSESELSDLLSEITKENDLSNEGFESEEERIRYLQMQEMLEDDLTEDEMKTDKAWSYALKPMIGENGRYLRTKYGGIYRKTTPVTMTEKLEQNKIRTAASVVANKEKARLRRLRILEIQRDAINSEFLPVYSEFTRENKTLLIELLTAEAYRIMVRSEKFVNKRLEELLLPLIPTSIRRCAAYYPESIKFSPGFLYKASEEYGEGKHLWVTPKMPYYFSQGTEMDILRENNEDALYKIDKAVATFHRCKNELADKEFRYALRIKDLKTYYQLVKHNPMWYDKLKEELLKRKAEQDK